MKCHIEVLGNLGHTITKSTHKSQDNLSPLNNLACCTLQAVSDESSQVRALTMALQLPWSL